MSSEKMKVNPHLLAKSREKDGATAIGRCVLRWTVVVVVLLGALAWGQAAPEKVIIDTDIGDDVDDAFALALAVKSPELQVLGVTTTFGDTEARAKIVDRFLGEVGREDIPVLAGKATATKNPMSQRKYGDEGHFAKNSHGDAVEFLLDQIRKYPGEITLIAIGPLMNVGAAIDKDATTFRKLKRVVLMGGSVTARVRGLGIYGAGASDAGVEYSERHPFGAEIVYGGRSALCDAPGFDAT